MVGPPCDHAALTGPVKAGEIDFAACRLNGDGWVHKTFPSDAHVEQGSANGHGWVVREWHFSRTVRRLMEGTTGICRSALKG